MYAVYAVLVAMLLPAAAYSEGTMTMGTPGIVDVTGSQITGQINVNQKFYIASNISNTSEGHNAFVYIVKISDQAGTTIMLEWFGGEVGPDQMLDIAVSWVPAAPGVYTVDVFLWDGLRTQNALDAAKSITISVS